MVSCSKDLKFQDYFRFSRDGLIYLFRDFSEVKLYAIRGRVSTPLSLFGFWKFKVEKYLGSVPSKIFLDKEYQIVILKYQDMLYGQKNKQ